MPWFLLTTISLVSLAAALALWRQMDRRSERQAWRELIKLARQDGTTIDWNALDGLPEPAQRFLRYSLPLDAELHRVVEIEMEGELGLGSKARPNYKPMRASQVLAPPYGLVWKLRYGVLAGSDAALPQTSWTRFWLFGFIPLVRAGGHSDHHRSAFGRVVAEGAFWAPASLLPSERVHWAALGENTARATVTFGEFEQAVDVTVAESGQPTEVVIQRWSNENAERKFRLQPFGGYLSDFKDFDGCQLPTRVEGGNHFGTDEYFPFYRVVIKSVSYPKSGL